MLVLILLLEFPLEGIPLLKEIQYNRNLGWDPQYVLQTLEEEEMEAVYRERRPSSPLVMRVPGSLSPTGEVTGQLSNSEGMSSCAGIGSLFLFCERTKQNKTKELRESAFSRLSHCRGVCVRFN